MSKSIDTKRVGDFCNYLFSTLDNLDLLPKKLSARPTEYEKYPRLLFGLLRRYGSVEAGFREWESKILRDSHKKEKYYTKLVLLYDWMMKNSDLFQENKETISYLSKSLYGRLYNYLYPRRLLISEYIRTYQGESKAAEASFIDENFDRGVSSAEEQLKKEKIFNDDEFSLLKKEVSNYIKDRSSYYEKVLSGKKEQEDLNNDQQ